MSNFGKVFAPKVTAKGTELPLLNLKGKPYLQVAHRLVWFREDHPNGIIKTQLMDHQNESSLFRAEIYAGNGAQGPQLVATAHKRESKENFADYIEKSETGAIGRALALMGYGTQFEPDLDEGLRLADAPVDVAAKAKVETTTKVETATKKGFRKDRAAAVEEVAAIEITQTPITNGAGSSSEAWE